MHLQRALQEDAERELGNPEARLRQETPNGTSGMSQLRDVWAARVSKQGRCPKTPRVGPRLGQVGQSVTEM